CERVIAAARGAFCLASRGVEATFRGGGAGASSFAGHRGMGRFGMGLMATKGLADTATETPAGVVWTKTSPELQRELGDATCGSWVAEASLGVSPAGDLCVVTPTGIARDWIRRYAWRRISELWTANDPDHREVVLKSRPEFEAEGGQCAQRPLALEAA